MIEFIDFNVIHESWDKYQLPDDKILKLHTLLVMPIKETEDGGVKYTLRTSINYTILDNTNLIGINNDGKFPKEKVIDSLIENQIKPISVLESSENKYKLNDGRTVCIKTEIEWVQKTNLFNNGIPIYYLKTNKIDTIK